MVSLLKRMHTLKKLLNIRLGPGAAVFPPKSPTNLLPVTRLDLVFKYDEKQKRVSSFFDAGQGHLRQFWRHHLPRLKYHNPGVQMNVFREAGKNPTEPWAQLWVYFGEVDAGFRPADQSRYPPAKKAQSPSTAQPISENQKDAAVPSETQEKPKDTSPDSPLQTQSPLDPTLYQYDRKKGRPALLSRPQTVSSLPSKPLGFKIAISRPSEEIYQDLLTLTEATEISATEEESAELAQLKAEEDRAEQDRVRVAGILADKRKEEETLRMARGEVQRMRETAAA